MKIKNFETFTSLESAKKAWDKIENNHSWEFDYFWENIQKSYGEIYRFSYGLYDDFEYELDLEYYSRSEHFPWENNPESEKRNGYIRVKTKTHGASGGSCWGYEATYFDTDNRVHLDDILKFIGHILECVFGKDSVYFSDVSIIIEKIKNNYSSYITEGDDTEYEYYGNYTVYQWLQITLWDLYVVLCDLKVI